MSLEAKPVVLVAGIAGGVGTTVVAAVVGGIDAGRDIETADVIVARNDYRCARALFDADLHDGQRVLVICEPARSLTHDDFTHILQRPVEFIDADPRVGRADDAGLLDLDLTKPGLGFRNPLIALRAAALGSSSFA